MDTNRKRPVLLQIKAIVRDAISNFHQRDTVRGSKCSRHDLMISLHIAPLDEPSM